MFVNFQKNSAAVICHQMKQFIYPLQRTIAQQHSSGIYEPDYLEVCCFGQ
jgi:hypothetical protein